MSSRRTRQGPGLGTTMIGFALFTTYISLFSSDPGFILNILEGSAPLYVLLRIGRQKSTIEISLAILTAILLLSGALCPAIRPFDHPFLRYHFHYFHHDMLGRRLSLAMLAAFYSIAAAEAMAIRHRRIAEAPRSVTGPRQADSRVILMARLLVPSTALLISWLLLALLTGHYSSWGIMTFNTTVATTAALVVTMRRPKLLNMWDYDHTVKLTLLFAVVWGLSMAILFVKEPQGIIRRANFTTQAGSRVPNRLAGGTATRSVPGIGTGQSRPTVDLRAGFGG